MAFTVDYAEIGRNVRKFREREGWSQSKLAEKIGISVQHISNVENGATVGLSTLLAICTALNADANSIIGANLPNTAKIAHLEQLLKIIKSNRVDTDALEQLISLVKQVQALQGGAVT